MNERIKELAEQAGGGPSKWYTNPDVLEKFAELIVKDCMVISKTWEDQLEKAKQLSESNAVGIVTYRISRQFGVEE